MSATELVLLFASGLAAGTINGAVGSGSLVTLPVLMWIGFDPASAITTNTIAIMSSSVGGVMAYRSELSDQRPFWRKFFWISIVGSVIGSVLLLTTPAAAVRIVVPVLIGLAIILVVFQPRLSVWVGRRNAEGSQQPRREASGALRASILGASVYGGYFAAAQGVLLLGILGVFTGKPMREVNGVKNLLTLIGNVTAALAFMVAAGLGHATIVWAAVVSIGLGAIVGGYCGGRFAKRIPEGLLRAIVVIIALTALIKEIVE